MNNKLYLLVFYLMQWTWGIMQNVLGFLLFCLLYLKKGKLKTEMYRGAIATMWRQRSSVSLGMFIFLGTSDRRVLVHEYGHCIQSMILGPLYLPLIGIPSFIWCNAPHFRRQRKKGTCRYSSFYTEKWANHLGHKVTNEEPISH
ncbi:MAG: hypothetical protein IKD94_00335 [Erysipelotrichaceae bacterium]|nr:hypothetical protein [Erysipelotrichaceae bacterium]